MNAPALVVLVHVLALACPIVRAQAPLQRVTTDIVAPTPPAGSHWVEGRVELPAGVPNDEAVFVVADATGLTKFDHHRVARREADGGFRVAFGPEVQSGWLRLDARYAYLENDVAWRLEPPKDPARVDTSSGDVVLKPRLGGALRGLLVGDPTASFEEPWRKEFAGATVELVGTPLQPGSNPLTRTAKVAGEPRFECGGLAPDHEWSATLVVPGYVPMFSDALRVKPGEVTTITWNVRRGATLRGRVVDASGAPVPGADLDVLSDELLFVQAPAESSSFRRTNVRGEFEWTGAPIGHVTLHAQCDGWWPAHLALEDLREGETREGIVVTLPLGNVVTGRVLDPDRAPAAGARVRVVQARANAPTLQREVVAGADGTFRLGGLYEARVTITATLERDPTVVGDARPADGVASGRRAITTPQRLRWRAVVDGVEPDRRDLEIVLVPGLRVRGRVLDDLGRTIVRYKAGARRAIGTDPHAQPTVIDVQNADGAFQLEDLEPGEWDVFAYGPGIVYAPPRRITVPYTGEDIVFVVRRPATVSGIVLDAKRAPVGKALVEVEWERAQLLGGAMATETTSVTAAADGRFEVTDVVPGAVRVRVTPAGGTKSKPFPLELKSGATQSGVEIVLDP